MRVLYLMTARGGSKGVPGKNLRRIGDWSLVEWKARGALRSDACGGILMSTDSEEIAREARRVGCTVPFLRPADLATDTASSLDVIGHAMDWLDAHGERYDAIMLLEPSAPFTRPSDYNDAVALMRVRDAALVVGMREVEVASRFIAPLDADGRITPIIDAITALRSAGRRQDLPPEYTMNAALYLFRWDTFRTHRQVYADRERSYGLPMDRYYSVEIDAPVDLAWAEFLVANGYVDTSLWTA